MQNKYKVSIVIFVCIFDDSCDLPSLFAIFRPRYFPSHVGLVVDVKTVLGGEIFKLI